MPEEYAWARRTLAVSGSNFKGFLGWDQVENFSLIIFSKNNILSNHKNELIPNIVNVRSDFSNTFEECQIHISSIRGFMIWFPGYLRPRYRDGN